MKTCNKSTKNLWIVTGKVLIIIEVEKAVVLVLAARYSGRGTHTVTPNASHGG